MPNGVKYVTNFIESIGAISTIDQSYLSSPVQTVSGGTDWVAMTDIGTFSNSSAIKTDGTLWLWGDGACGRLGNNSVANQTSPVQTISAGNNWKQLSSGERVSAAIKTDGTLWLWGRGLNGQLGNNSVTDRSSPVQTISTGQNWKQVSASHQHVAAIKTDGTLWLWGRGYYGNLGNNSSIFHSSPVQTISNGTNWKQVSAGASPQGSTYYGSAGTAAVKTDGTLWIWGGAGFNPPGPVLLIGNNSTTARSSPTQTISAGTNWKQVATSSWGSAAVKTDGTLWLWGGGNYGILGNNSTLSFSSPIQTISATNNWDSVELSTRATAATKTDGTLWLWGNNGSLGAPLGDGTTTNRSSPVQTIATGRNWVSAKIIAFYGSGSTTTALKTDGTLWLWGYGGTGRLGNNATTNQVSPVQTVSATQTWLPASPQSFDTALNNSAAVKSDGTLWLWGNNANGQLGNNAVNIRQSSPIQTISVGTNWRTVITGQTSAAIKTDGTLWIWGKGSAGQIGNNSTVDRSSPTQTVSATTNWSQVDGGSYTPVVAIKTDGTLWMWGPGYAGVLGNNSTISRSSPVQTVSATTNWKQASVGSYVASAVKTDGTLWLWGCGNYGILGNNSTVFRSSPVQTVSATTNWKQVSVGYAVSAIKTDGTLWTWGNNLRGQLGNNTSNVGQSSPVQTISGGTNWKLTSSGGPRTAAIKTDGTLWIWGRNTSGDLGNNSTIDRSSPVQTVSATTDWVSVNSGYHTLATKSSGEIYGWGSNFYGELAIPLVKTEDTLVELDLGNILLEKEYLLDVYPNLIPQVTQPALWLWGVNTGGRLGNGSTIDRSSPVQTVASGTDWRFITLGQGYGASAIKTNGTLWLWGCNGVGQLGNNSSVTHSSPVQTVSGGTNWQSASASVCHIAAIKTDGTLWLWGAGVSGIIGNNSTLNRSSPTQTISATTDWKSVSVGRDGLTGSIKTDGTLWMWGTGSLGQIGNNSTLNRSRPTQTISATTNWRQVSAGGQHVMATKTDGTLWLWGRNADGVLGNNSTINQSSPVQTVAGGTNWKSVATGRYHASAIKTDGTLWLWGQGGTGRLGNNSTVTLSSPVQTVSGGTNWKFNVPGRNFHAAIKTDGTLWTWGANVSGQLGNASTIDRSSPVQTVTGGTAWKQANGGDAHMFAIQEQGDW